MTDTNPISDSQQSDNFIEAYRLLEQGAEMYARLYGLDEFTVWNHIAGEADKVRLRMYEGFIDKPVTYAHIEAVKGNEDGNMVMTIKKGDKSKDVELTGRLQMVDLSDLEPTKNSEDGKS